MVSRWPRRTRPSSALTRSGRRDDDPFGLGRAHGGMIAQDADPVAGGLLATLVTAPCLPGRTFHGPSMTADLAGRREAAW